MRSCERCGCEVSWTHDTHTLAGNVTAHLCTSCQREFNAAYLASDRCRSDYALAARQAHYGSLAEAGKPVSEAQWQALYKDMAGNARACAEFSTAFLAAGIEAKS